MATLGPADRDEPTGVDSGCWNICRDLYRCRINAGTYIAAEQMPGYPPAPLAALLVSHVEF
jgi:hypothetical protein